MEVDLVTLNKQCSEVLLSFRGAFKKELGASHAEHEENGVDRAALNPQWNIDTAISTMFEGFGWAMPKGMQMLGGGRSIKVVLRENVPSHSRFGIALKVFNDLLHTLLCEVNVLPLDVVTAARRARGFTFERKAKMFWENNAGNSN